MDAIQDEEMQDVLAPQPDETLPLSDDEQRVLELYDQLKQLQMEIAIINAQARPEIVAGDDSPEGMASAQNALLGARAKYRLRNDAIDYVMMANPIIKAVHNGKNSTPIERDLLPYIERRDQESMAAAVGARDTWTIRTELTRVQSDTIRACRRNVTLTSELLSLAGELKEKKAVDMDDAAVATRLESLEAELKKSRRGWRLVKGVASGVVAGSGVDWASDETLRDMVLEPEDED